MAELTGSEILAKALKNEGTDDLFFLMGGPMLLAESSCIKEGIRPIDVRHFGQPFLKIEEAVRLAQRLENVQIFPVFNGIAVIIAHGHFYPSMAIFTKFEAIIAGFCAVSTLLFLDKSNVFNDLWFDYLFGTSVAKGSQCRE